MCANRKEVPDRIHLRLGGDLFEGSFWIQSIDFMCVVGSFFCCIVCVCLFLGRCEW